MSYGQPLDVVQKLVRCGGKIESPALNASICRGDLHIVEYLLAQGPYDPRGGALEAAWDVGDEAVIELVEKRARNLTRAERSVEKGVRKREKGRGKNAEGTSWRFWRWSGRRLVSSAWKLVRKSSDCWVVQAEEI